MVHSIVAGVLKNTNNQRLDMFLELVRLKLNTIKMLEQAELANLQKLKITSKNAGTGFPSRPAVIFRPSKWRSKPFPEVYEKFQCFSSFFSKMVKMIKIRNCPPMEACLTNSVC